MANLKKVTLLHSNDMHGDFLAEDIDNKLIGGVSMLSGYINKCRNIDDNVLYVIAGDMFRGSVIDSEYQGISTIQIVNLLSPDVVTIGNHEVDYGVAHLLFIEKLSQFPIINCNLYIKLTGKRLFEPHHILEIDGMRILFIGVITEDVIHQTKAEALVGAFVDVEEAAKEVGRICNAYNNEDIDFTVLLTHIGFEEDKKLAELLDDNWGVDLIIGGHSHTFMDQPEVVNGVPIAHAGTGTDQIGRFDIIVDTDNNCIDSFTWQAIDINEDNCPKDKKMEKLINSIKAKTDLKYARVIGKFDYELTHPSRWMQTDMGGVFADALMNSFDVDIFLCGSGGLRVNKVGPIMTYQDFCECYPYDGACYKLILTGKQLKDCLRYVYRDEAWEDGGHTEFFQLSMGLEVVYSKSRHDFLKFNYKGREVKDNDMFSVGIENFHYNNLETSLNITKEEIENNAPIKVLTTSSVQVLTEYFEDYEHLGFGTDNRLTVID